MCLRECKIARVAFLRPRGNRPVTCCPKSDTQTTFLHVETLDLVCAWVQNRAYGVSAQRATRVSPISHVEAAKKGRADTAQHCGDDLCLRGCKIARMAQGAKARAEMPSDLLARSCVCVGVKSRVWRFCAKGRAETAQ